MMAHRVNDRSHLLEPAHSGRTLITKMIDNGGDMKIVKRLVLAVLAAGLLVLSTAAAARAESNWLGPSHPGQSHLVACSIVAAKAAAPATTCP
jgi:hypothetical protein